MSADPKGPFTLYAMRDEESDFERREVFADIDAAIDAGRALLGDFAEFKVRDWAGACVQHETT